MKEVLDWLVHIVIAVVIGFLIVNFVAQITIVNGRSMEITLQHNDRLIIEKITPRFGKIDKGDIVTVDVSDIKTLVEHSPIIKRVIGTEGDTVEIREGKVYVNENVLDEKYISGDRTSEVNVNFSKVVVQKGFIYVMGDNRHEGASNDSRNIGPVSINRVGGKAVLRFFPFNKFGILK